MTVVYYGSNVADSTLTTACELATATGGTETSAASVYTTGAHEYAEAYSQGTASGATWAAIPATPTGNGWVIAPGLGAFDAGNWSATLGLHDPTGPSPVDDLTLRFFKYSGGGSYALLGDIVVTSVTINTTRTTVSFAATAFLQAAFGLGEKLYVDLWYHTIGASIEAIQPAIYVSTSATAGVVGDLQITAPAFVPSGEDPAIIVAYGSSVSATTLATACAMPQVTGGVETTFTTTFTGTGAFGEILPKGGSSVSVASLPTPSGKGWVFAPGAGSFAAANWSGSVALHDPTGSYVLTSITLRFSKYSSGAYSAIGSIVVNSPTIQTTRQVFSFAATAMPAVTTTASDLIYVDLWWSDGGITGDSPAVYTSTSATAGVTGDMQITTALFTPAPASVGPKPRYITRGFLSTIIPDVVTQPLAYVERGPLGTIIYESRTFVPRALGGTYIPDDSTLVWVPRGIGGTLQIAAGRALAGTLPGVGALTGSLSAATALSGTLAGVGVLSPTLSAALDLGTATLAGVGTLTGTASLATAVTATFAGVGTLVGPLSASLTLPGVTLDGVGTLSGSMAVGGNVALAVTLAGVGTLAGAFSLATALTSTLAGVGTLTGTITLATSLTVTMAGIGTLTGTLSTSGAVALTVTMAGVGVFTPAVPALKTALSSTLAGVGTLAGALSASLALPSTTLPGAGTLTGTLLFSTALARTLIGAGTLSGAYSLRVALALTFAGTGTLSGVLQLPAFSYLTATWVTRDGQATWVARDGTITWTTRDEQAAWKARS